MKPPLVVGLTGGIGSGKSVVGHAFAALGVEIADADAAAHAISAKGMPGHAMVAAAFGPGAVGCDGELDRAWLRQQVFVDRSARKRLEDLLHPLISAWLDQAVAQWHGPYGLLMVPLLLERGRVEDRVARVLVVDCSEEQQIRRAAARSGIGPDDVRAIMAAQCSRAARLAQADDVIDNSGAPEEIIPQVARLDAFYRACAARNPSNSPGGT
jgi:dephospho-CoA kinase